MSDDEHPRWWGEAGSDPRPEPPGWWPETDTLSWVRKPEPVGDESPARGE